MANVPDPQQGPPQQEPSDSSGLDPKEKAKMDHQARLEQEKLDKQYDLKWWELVWDKGIFTLVLTLLGGAALFGFNSCMERYKLQEARDRFFTEKRLDALVAVSAAVSEMTGVFFKYADKNEAPPEKVKQAYTQAIDKAREAVNKHTVILGKDFDADLSRYIQVHRSLRDIPVEKWLPYRDFVSDLDNQFIDLCQNRLRGNETFRMDLLRIRFEQRIRMSPEEYLTKQFEHWNASKAKAAH